MSIEVRNITKRFGSFTALNNVSLEVRSGELVALLGPSGSGKTTLLRIIAGLEFADAGSGQVCFNGEDVTHRSAAARQVGFAFQHYALFRHMTVFENIAFGLRVRPRAERPAESEIRRRVAELLKLVQLEQFEQRFPSQLSGGQRQRVALARALAVEPKVLLLDEPFGALDAKVRKELRRWLRELHEKVPITTLFVTHDQDEALEVASRIVVMNEGRIEQIGAPDEVYDRPANPFVYNFLGNVNLFHGRIHEGLVHLGNTAFAVAGHDAAASVPAIAYVRPHEIKVLSRPNGVGSLPALIRYVNSAGPLVRLELERADDRGPFSVELTREEGRGLALQPGAQVYVELKNLRVFADDYSI
ncbi:MAG: sulfate ABC transporter ATP-binding protein [Verrucomicrobia bacterium]|nr:sulfate ABC transporter ATP-binding protein [Verrucomicrobiota bacterium]